MENEQILEPNGGRNKMVKSIGFTEQKVREMEVELHGIRTVLEGISKEKEHLELVRNLEIEVRDLTASLTNREEDLALMQSTVQKQKKTINGLNTTINTLRSDMAAHRNHLYEERMRSNEYYSDLVTYEIENKKLENTNHILNVQLRNNKEKILTEVPLTNVATRIEYNLFLFTQLLYIIKTVFLVLMFGGIFFVCTYRFYIYYCSEFTLLVKDNLTYLVDIHEDIAMVVSYIFDYTVNTNKGNIQWLSNEIISVIPDIHIGYLKPYTIEFVDVRIDVNSNFVQNMSVLIFCLLFPSTIYLLLKLWRQRSTLKRQSRLIENYMKTITKANLDGTILTELNTYYNEQMVDYRKKMALYNKQRSWNHIITQWRAHDLTNAQLYNHNGGVGWLAYFQEHRDDLVLPKPEKPEEPKLESSYQRFIGAMNETLNVKPTIWVKIKDIAQSTIFYSSIVMVICASAYSLVYHYKYYFQFGEFILMSTELFLSILYNIMNIPTYIFVGAFSVPTVLYFVYKKAKYYLAKYYERIGNNLSAYLKIPVFKPKSAPLVINGEDFYRND